MGGGEALLCGKHRDTKYLQGAGARGGGMEMLEIIWSYPPKKLSPNVRNRDVFGDVIKIKKNVTKSQETNQPPQTH